MNHSTSQSSSHSSSEQKFRPYLSSSELLLIIRTLKSDSAPAIGLIRYLETFAIKIERGIISPQLRLQESLASRLGFESSPSSSPESGESPETLAMRWESMPSERHKFSPAQLATIQAWRYENDRMSPEEESAYETSLMGG